MKNFKECKVEGCDRPVRKKGFCYRHLILFKEGLLSFSGIPVQNESRVRLPRRWKDRTPESKVACILELSDIWVLEHIILKEHDPNIKDYAMKRIGYLIKNPAYKEYKELGKNFKDKVLRNNSYKCKIKGCEGKPNAQGNFTKGFCNRHYNHFIKGIIDIEGRSLREVVSKHDMKKVICKVEGCSFFSFKNCFCEYHYAEYKEGIRDIHGNKLAPTKLGKIIDRPLKKFNQIVRDLIFVRKKLEQLRNENFVDIDDNILKQVAFLDDSLKFLNNPGFIMDSLPLFSNLTLKYLLGGEIDEPINIKMEVFDGKKKRKFKGILRKGENANIAVTQYELVNKEKKESEILLFLKDHFNAKFPFECNASNMDGTVVHHVKISEDR